MVALVTILGFIFVIGLCVGSFLNVVILRTISNESIVFPASKCPTCGKALKWWHNIPVLSYILLRGKCGFCKCKISIQYPIVEAVTGILFTLTFLKFFLIPATTNGITIGSYIDTVYSWIVVSLLLVMAVTDIKEKVVFDVHTISLVVVGLLYSLLITGWAVYVSLQLSGTLPLNASFLVNNPITYSILGILSGVVIMELLARSGYLFAGTRAFGEGDTFIAAGIGAVLGWKQLIAALILSVFVQFVLTMPIFLKRLIQNKDYKTFSALVGFIIYAILLYILQIKHILDGGIIHFVATIILATIGIYACVRVLRGIKENQENMLKLPFGPAMAIATLIMIAL